MAAVVRGIDAAFLPAAVEVAGKNDLDFGHCRGTLQSFHHDPTDLGSARGFEEVLDRDFRLRPPKFIPALRGRITSHHWIVSHPQSEVQQTLRQ